jgi:putative oxidoreductase
MGFMTQAYSPQWGLAVLRIIAGLVFFMHGWQKVTMFGLEGFTGFLTQLGVPAAGLAAVVVIAVELLGGLAMMLGLGTRWVAIPLAVDMLVAMLLVHLPNGFFVSEGGYELVLLLFGAAVTLFLSGSGAFALDNLVFRARTTAGSTRTA